MRPQVINALAALVLVLAAFAPLLILVATYQAGSC